MEVSSHALVLGRADAISFAVAGFTNLGRDHLDFHPDEEAYFAAKAALFTAERSRHAVINIDDPRGAELAERVRRAGELGLTTVSLTAAADCRTLACRAAGRTAGPLVRARLGDQPVEFTLGLPGDFNVRNALTALAMVAATGGRRGRRGRGSGRRLGAGPDAAGRPRPGRAGGLRRLRPHPAGRGRRPAGGRGPAADRGARLRRRPRPGQARTDGRSRGRRRRPGGGHRRQPAVRVAGGDPRPGAGRRAGRGAAGRVGDRGASTGATAGRPSGRRWSGPAGRRRRGPGQGHEPGQEIAGARCCRSATRRWSPRSGPRCAGVRR